MPYLSVVQQDIAIIVGGFALLGAYALINHLCAFLTHKHH